MGLLLQTHSQAATRGRGCADLVSYSHVVPLHNFPLGFFLSLPIFS